MFTLPASPIRFAHPMFRWRCTWVLVFAVLALTLAMALPLVAEARGDAAGAKPPPPAAAPPPATPSAPAAPESIPAPDIARRAEEVTRLLRELEALATPGPMIEAIRRQLPETDTHVKRLSEDTTTQLDAEASAATLDGLTEQWQTTRALLAGHVNVLGQRATA